MASHDHDRAVALSRQLAQAHQQLRDRLHELRDNLGADDPNDTQLTSHCLAFCAALTTHHRAEDEGMFTALLHERPDLAPTITNLVEDHQMIATILARLAELAALTPPQDWSETVREIDGLTAIVESHFAYEERAISQTLDNILPDTGWSAQVFAFRLKVT